MFYVDFNLTNIRHVSVIEPTFLILQTWLCNIFASLKHATYTCEYVGVPANGECDTLIFMVSCLSLLLFLMLLYVVSRPKMRAALSQTHWEQAKTQCE